MLYELVRAFCSRVHSYNQQRRLFTGYRHLAESLSGSSPSLAGGGRELCSLRWIEQTRGF